MPGQYICTVCENRPLGADTYWLTLSCGRMAEETFRAPGQFVHIACGAGNLLRRPISVAVCRREAEEDMLAVVFQIRGKGTAWLAERQPGDKLDVLGLLGNGFPLRPRASGQSGRYLLAGGGIGVPPLLGCAQFAASNGGSATAVLGFRDGGKAILLEHFGETCKDVRLYTDDGSLGAKGYVHDGVRAVLDKDKDFTAVLACGPKPMLRGVVKTAAEFGVPCLVSMEERMACGVGACLGCAIPMADGSMKHVCKDGPVFAAEEVDWDA